MGEKMKKRASIYKLSFPNGDRYFPKPIYYGITTNLEVRKKTHFREINRYLSIFKTFNFKEQIKTNEQFSTILYQNQVEKIYQSKIDVNATMRTIALILYHQLAAKDALYLKLASFMLLNNLTMDDLKFEVIEELEKLEYDDKFHFEREQYWISKNNYEAERLGFNGPNARFFAISSLYERYNSQQFGTQLLNELKFMFKKFDEWIKDEHSIIIEFNLIQKNKTSHQKWTQFCDEVYQKTI